MNEMTIFNSPEFGKMRTIEKDGQLWFVLKDVCALFGETNYRRVSTRLDNDEKGVSQFPTAGGKQDMTIVNESGLYTALFQMQPGKARGVTAEYVEKRQAQLEEFKRWVTEEVLPSIRRNGGYIQGQADMGPEELMAAALLVAQKTIEERKAKLGFVWAFPGAGLQENAH